MAADASFEVESIDHVMVVTINRPQARNAWGVNASHVAMLARSEDAREGPRAFAEKRPPQ